MFFNLLFFFWYLQAADIYLIDEPSAHLDSEQRLLAAKVIKRFILHQKKTAFIVEHDFIMATYLADKQPVRLAGSFRCWFVKKYCWLVCVREKYCSGWKFTIVYDKPQPNEQAVVLHIGGGNGPVGESLFSMCAHQRRFVKKHLKWLQEIKAFLVKRL